MMTTSSGAMDRSDGFGILAAIASAASAPELREERAASIARLIRQAGDYRWVGLYDVHAVEIVNIAWSGSGPPAHPRFPRSLGLSGAAVATAKTVASNDVAHDPRYLTAFMDTGSEIIVPVAVGDEVRGTLDVESAATGAFGPDDQAFLERCAGAAVQLWR
jgi:putative methionine-R-sulfoxide reductase with GAF domain